MTNLPVLETERLLLRPWRDEDLGPFAALNADPRVMEFFPSTLAREESDAFASRIRTHFEQWGYGLWAAELPEVAPFIGFVGLQWTTFETHANLPAQKTIEKLGLVRDPAGDFEHPRLPAGHPLRRHLLYRLRNEG